MGWLAVIGLCTVAVIIYRALFGSPITSSSRVTCPVCKEAVMPTALVCPHCLANLVQGPVGQAMRAQREELIRLVRGQRLGNRLIVSMLLAMIVATIIYIRIVTR